MNDDEARASAEVVAKNYLDLGMALEDDPLLSGLLFLQSIAFSSVATGGLTPERMTMIEYLSERIDELSRAKLVGLLESLMTVGMDLNTYKEILN